VPAAPLFISYSHVPAAPLFISYSHKDQKWLDLLSVHLQSLENDGLIETWDDRDIRAGGKETWEAQLLPKIESAGVIVVLLSPDFAASDYCQKVELPIAITRKEKGQALVYFVLVRPYAVERSLSRFQILPSLNQSLKQIRDKDEALKKIACLIRDELEDFHPSPSQSPRVTRVLPPYLPYLCDRAEQEDHLQLLCGEQSCPRPLAFLVTGPRQECHDAFHERMARDLLPGLLHIPGATPTDPRLLEWFADAAPGPGCDSLFSARIGRTLGVFGKDPATVTRSLPEGLTLLVTTLFEDDWASHDRELLKCFLSYWNNWPDLAPKRALCLGVSIVTRGKGSFSAKLEAAFAASAYPALRLRVLPELRPPQESHARNWLSHPKVKPWYNWELYRDPLRDRVSQMFADRRAIPMGDLARRLLEAIESCS
jgi:TIR domain/inactive STAND